MRFAFDTWIKPVIKTVYLTARKYTLRGLRFFLSREKSDPTSESLRNILFIRVDRIGDMVLSIPAFEAIKVAFPRAQLTVMASMVNAAILKNNPHVDEVIVYDRAASLPDKIRLFKGLRRRRFDLAVDPCDDDELETAWMTWMSAATRRIGYAAFGREVFFNESIQRTQENKHFVDVTLDLLKFIGISSHNRHPAIHLDEFEQLWATQWINEKKLQDKILVAIHPGAYYESQRWPPEYYADLIRLIHKHTEAEVIVFGGPSDNIVIESILNKVKNPVCVSIQNDIRRFLALLSRCRMLVCNNSGPLHCAVALNVPTISFLGPTAQTRWEPIGDMHHVLRMDDLRCIGCDLGYCGVKTHDCMQFIKPDNVLDLVMERLISEN